MQHVEAEQRHGTPTPGEAKEKRGVERLRRCAADHRLATEELSKEKHSKGTAMTAGLGAALQRHSYA